LGSCLQLPVSATRPRRRRLLLLLLLLLLAFPGTDYSCEKTFVVVVGVVVAVGVVVEIKGISVDQEPVLKVWNWRKGSGSK